MKVDVFTSGQVWSLSRLKNTLDLAAHSFVSISPTVSLRLRVPRVVVPSVHHGALTDLGELHGQSFRLARGWMHHLHVSGQEDHCGLLSSVWSLVVSAVNIALQWCNTIVSNPLVV